MSVRYTESLDESGDIQLRVEFITAGPEVVDYALVLVARKEEGLMSIRVYDGAHGRNEMHRFTRSAGKQPAVRFHDGTLGEGMRAAKEEIMRAYPQMIEGWDR